MSCLHRSFVTTDFKKEHFSENEFEYYESMKSYSINFKLQF